MDKTINPVRFSTHRENPLLQTVDMDSNKFEIHMWSDIDCFFYREIPIWKRMTDILVTSTLLFLFSPLFFFLSVLIKIVSPGPVLFIQERVGFRGKRFNLYKFRTMETNYDANQHRQQISQLISRGKNKNEDALPMTKLDKDNPSIISFGRFLRSSCLDELPQLINVLRGEMSLIGPRPPIPYEVADYTGWYNERFDAIPGMTGLWQVSGKNNLPFLEMVRMDIYYCRNISAWLDAKIFLMTPLVILSELMSFGKND